MPNNNKIKTETKKNKTKTNNDKNRKSRIKTTVLVIVLTILGVFGVLVIGHFVFKSCKPSDQIYNVKILQPSDPQWELKVNGQKEEVNVKYNDLLEVTVKSTLSTANDYSLLNSYSGTSNESQLICARITDQNDPTKMVAESSILTYDETQDLYKVSLFVTWKDYPKTLLQLAQKTEFEGDIYTKDEETDTIKFVYDDTLFGVDNEYIHYYDCSATPVVEKTVPRRQFNQKLWIGNKIDTLPESFLASCTSFNSSITFNPGNLNRIGNDFLWDCPSFNQPIEFPDSLTNIGDDFMYGCRAFNKPINLKNVNFIGETFLRQCLSFNSNITFGSSLKLIGSYFLIDCTSFNKDLIIPSSVDKINDGFLCYCQDMTGTITINCPETAFDFHSTHVCCSKTNTAPSYTEGIKINGTYADEWIKHFPNIDEPGASEVLYRKLVKTS